MGRAVSPPCCLARGQTMVGVMKVMATSTNRTCACTVVFTLWSHLCTPCSRSLSTHASARLLDTHRQVWLCLLWGHCFFLLAPGTHKVLFCALQGSVSPVLWKFCNQIPMAFEVKFPGGSQSFCQTPRLGNLLWVLLWEFIGRTVL